MAASGWMWNDGAVGQAGAPRTLFQGWPDRLTNGFAVLGIALLLTCSPMLLFQFGLRYEATGGSPLEKIHPGTLALAFAFLCSAFARPHPLAALAAPFVADRGILLFLMCWLLLLVHVIAVMKAPFTPLIDTFLLPMIVMVVLPRLSQRTCEQLAIVIHVAMALNALVALYEYLAFTNVIPFVIMGEVLTKDIDWRSTALMGHPLHNAAMTGIYAVTILRGGLKPAWRGALVPLVLLQLAAMVAFGGRTALVLLLLIVLLLAGMEALKVIGGRRVSLLGAATVIAAIPVAIVAGFGLYEIGFLDRLVARFLDDHGSAGTRVAMFELFERIPLRDILIGPNQDQVASERVLLGLEIGIESFWISLIFSYGLLVCIPFFCAFIGMCVSVLRFCGPGAWLPLAFFVAVASTSVSLGAKTVVFATTIILLRILIPPPAGVPPRHAVR
jgi:hypothetical protein